MTAPATALLLVGLMAAACGRDSRAATDAGETGAWRDPSPHEVTFVTVDEGVRLEVLDWGGSGPAVLLLAGSGHSAHVFDDIAPKLRDTAHVYGLTRRGYGASSQPESGYDEPRLAEDILCVLETLHVDKPVLVGHSMAGGELTRLGSRYSDRLGGLVYLDAHGDPTDWPASDPAYMELFRRLPPRTAPPCTRDGESFRAYRAWQQCAQKFAVPESELRSVYTTTPDGAKGPHKTPRRIHQAIGAGALKRDYAQIRVPVLVLHDPPSSPEDPFDPDEPPRSDEERAAIVAFRTATKAYTDRWTANLTRSLPDARLVELRGAGHFAFLTREADVLRELRAFIEGLTRFSIFLNGFG